ncbi:protein PAIR1 isoform X2 [Phalaenopsis equestris]|uniref:protein PAIR1 isoform X2 n=1 Tax=Phalaenopsis equestris TaxID=78828 RepID=UPI0009E43345|nr:protein PAIR1 isoform X2 [Phalaenopsis equestris]
MKFNINKACDLRSISVLPPHSRRVSTMNSGVDAYGLGRNQASQLRSQSQQSFSQGLSQSQISQNSFENLGNDQKFDSQERETASKRISSLAPIMPTREDSQLQLSRTSSNAMRQWSCTTAPDNKCQVSEELERRLRFQESSLNKLSMILDSLQSDVMQVNRAVKEVSLEVEGIRQKATLIDSSTQQVLKEEEDIKTRLDRSMKIISDEMMKKTDLNRVNEAAMEIPTFTKEIEAQLVGFRREICLIISKNMEVLKNSMKSIINNLPDAILSREARGCIAIQRRQKDHISNFEMPASSSLSHMRRDAVLNEPLKVLKPKLTNPSKYAIVKKEAIPMALKEQILIESDDESDGSLCILVKKETGVLSKTYNSVDLKYFIQETY